MTSTDTIYKLMGSFQDLLVANQGHAYASGYLGSFAASIAQNLSEAEKAEFLTDLANRIAEQTKNLSHKAG